MIDCGPCVHEFAATFGYHGLYKKVTSILVTHSHGDHFNADAVARVAAEADDAVTVYGDAVVGTLLPLSEKLKYLLIGSPAVGMAYALLKKLRMRNGG